MNESGNLNQVQFSLNLDNFFRGQKPTTWESYVGQIKGMTEFIQNRTSQLLTRFSNNEGIKSLVLSLSTLSAFNEGSFKQSVAQTAEKKESLYNYLFNAAVAAENLEKKLTHIFNPKELEENQDFKTLKDTLVGAVATYNPSPIS